MGRVVVSSFISLDGYTEARGREMVPPPPTPDLFRYFIEPNLSETGVAIYGRVTYEGMVGFWTSPSAPAQEAARLAEMRKVVFSKTLQKAEWGNVTIARGDNLAADVAAMKAETDRDLTILGSAMLVNAFLHADLVDALRLLVTPNTFGAGTPLFQGGYGRGKWKLAGSRAFDSGSVLLEYERG